MSKRVLKAGVGVLAGLAIMLGASGATFASTTDAPAGDSDAAPTCGPTEPIGEPPPGAIVEPAGKIEERPTEPIGEPPPGAVVVPAGKIGCAPSGPIGEPPPDSTVVPAEQIEDRE